MTFFFLSLHAIPSLLHPKSTVNSSDMWAQFVRLTTLPLSSLPYPLLPPADRQADKRRRLLLPPFRPLFYPFCPPATRASSNHLRYARLVLPRRPATLLAHNALLHALARGPRPGLAFAAFRDLPLPPDHYSLNFLVRAAAALAASATAEGRPARAEPDARLQAVSAHGAVVRWGHAADPHVQSGVLSMYAALGDVATARAAFAEIARPDVVCATAMVAALAAGGDMDAARAMFDGMPQRDHVAWSAMIAGYVHVGRSREALKLFDEMLSAGTTAGEATLVSVLTACAQMGALDRGKWIHSYVRSRGMQMSVKLGTALVDMYSKCGAVATAMEVFESMTERNVYTWTSAVSGLAMNGMGTECLRLFKRTEGAGIQPNGVSFVAVLGGCSMAGLVDEEAAAAVARAAVALGMVHPPPRPSALEPEAPRPARNGKRRRKARRRGGGRRPRATRAWPAAARRPEALARSRAAAGREGEEGGGAYLPACLLEEEEDKEGKRGAKWSI